MPHVTSRRNGLVVGVPPDARGVISRFKTKGDNELVFNQDAMDASLKPSGKAMKLDSPTAKPTGKGRRRSNAPSTDLV